MTETWNIIKKILKSKKIKEISEIIPEGFYQKSAFILSMICLFILPHEVFVRYTQHALSHITEYFYITGVMIVFFCVLTLIIKASKLSKKDRKEYFKRHLYDAMFILFLILATVSAICSKDIKTALYGAWGRNCGLRSYFIFFSMYVLGRYIKNDRKTKLVLYFVFSLVCAIQNLLPLTMYLGYFGRPEGAFHNINHAGYYMVVSMMAGIGFIILTENIILKVMGYCLYIFNMWALVINDSFGPYLALMCAIIFFSIIYTIKYKKIKWEIFFIVLIFVAESMVIDYKTDIVSNNFRITSNDAKKIATNSEDVERVGSGRMELWIYALKVIKNHPVLGVGPDVMNYDEPHNEVLQIASEEGIPAAVCYVLGIAMIVIAALREITKGSDILLIELSIVAGYIVSAMVGVIMYYTYGYFLFFLGILCTSKNESHL